MKWSKRSTRTNEVASALPTPSSEPDWENLGREFRKQREHLGLTRKEAAARSGVSEPLWEVVENAYRTNVTRPKLLAMNAALGFEPHMIEVFLRGVAAPDPITAAVDRVVPPVPTLTERLDEIAEELARLMTLVDDLAKEVSPCSQ